MIYLSIYQSINQYFSILKKDICINVIRSDSERYLNCYKGFFVSYKCYSFEFLLIK